MPIIAHQSDADQRQEDDDARLDAIYAPLVARDIASREGGMFRTPRQAAVAASTLGDVQGNAALANRNGWPVSVVASDPARFAAEDRRRRLDAVTDPDTSRYLSDPRRNALVGDDIEATNTLGASIKRLLRVSGGLLLNQATGGHGIDVARFVSAPYRGVQSAAPAAGRAASATTLNALSSTVEAIADNVHRFDPTSGVLNAFAAAAQAKGDAATAGALRAASDPLRIGALSEEAGNVSAFARGESSRELGAVGGLPSRSDWAADPSAALEQATRSLFAQSTASAPLMLAAFATRNPELGAMAMGVPTGAMTASELRADGIPWYKAYAAGGLTGSAEYIGESFGLGSLMQKSWRGALLRGPLTEYTQEFGTQIMQDAAEDAARGRTRSFGDAISQANNAGLTGMFTGTVIGSTRAIGAGAHRLATARGDRARDMFGNILSSAVDVNNLVALTRAAASAKLTEVDPAEAAAFAREHMAGGDGHVYVPVSEVAALYQDPAEQQAAFEALTGNATAAMDASVTGDIAVPLDRWVSQVARLPRAEELAHVARMTPGGLSNKDLQAFTPEQIQEDLARYYAESAEDSERASGAEGEVYDSFYGDLLPHYGQEGAARVAATMQAFYRTMGARIGVDAKTLFDRFRINIGGKRRGNPGVVPRDVDTTLDPMIDAAINGKAFSDDEIHGNAGGVISAILAAGGIRPDSVGADDLRSLQSLPPGFFNANGRTAEAMAEALAEDGWRGSFADVDSYGRPGANELYDLVRREVFGDKVRPDMDGADQDRATKREAINNDIATVRDAFKRYEAETGVDPATLPREQQREIALGGLNALDQTAYHGTPHTVDRFSLQKIGTGEGAQAYGYGLYFASAREIAEHYRKTLGKTTERFYVDGDLQFERDPNSIRGFDVSDPRTAAVFHVADLGYRQALLAYTNFNKGAYADKVRAEIEKLAGRNVTKETESTGNLYRVEVPEDSDLLDWDKPLSEQPEKVQQALAKFDIEVDGPRLSADGITINPETINGAGIYGYLSRFFGSERAASEALLRAGIPGLRYLDGNSRSKGEGSANYVIWDENAIGQPESALNQSSEDQTQSEAFGRWFGDSVVTENGKAGGEPLVVYHGSPDARFMDADATFMSLKDRYGDKEGVGAFWFAADRATAVSYADDRRAFDYQNAEPAVIGAYLKLENPLVVDGGGKEWREAQAIGKTTDVIEKAKAEGRDGVIIRNVRDNYNNGPRTKPTDTYVVFNSRQIKSADKNNGNFNPDNPSILKQGGKSPRGQIVGRDGESIIGQKAENGSREFNITLFEGKDLSTVLHEAGHAFFEIFGDLAEDANASEQLKADYQTLLEASGAKTRADVGREQHEWIARSFEAYTRDGKAPSASLRRAFAMFGTFLTRIYKVLSALNVNLTPEVRAVFDRMLASEEEIAEAQRAQSMEPLLREFDGWTSEQKAAYEAAVIEARGEAERRLAAEVLRAQQRAEKAWQGEERKKVKAQVEADMRALPVYRAIRWLRTGKMPDGEPVPRALKLSKQDLLDNYGPGILKHLRGMYSVEGGETADAVAAVLGFLSGRDMVDQMAKAPSLQDVVKADTDNIMAERYPDPMNDGSMAERAQKKVHSAKQRELMLLEINALERRAGRPPTQMQIMREAVKRILGGRPARTIAPGGYRAAEAKYGRMAFDALAKGDHAGALEARRQQMLNSLLYSEATKIRAEVEKAGKLFNRYTKKRTRAKVGKVGGTYLEQIDALLERFDFRQVSGPQSKRRMALRDWIDARLADGLPADFPKRLMDDAYRTPYKDMTVDQIRELRDAVVSIAYWASRKGKLLLAGELRSRKAIDSQMEASVLAGSKAQPDVPGHVDDSAFMKLWGEERRHIAAATDMARRLDGYVDLGAVWTNTVGVIRDAVSNNLNPALRQARETIAKLYLDNYTRSEIAHFKDLRTIAGVRGVWSRENILAVALNWGNEENRLAILTQERGRPTPEEVGRLLQTLTPKDWDFVEGVWQAIDAYWPQIAAAQRRRKGLAPKKVEASSFVVTLPDGTQRTIRGGYYPLKYAGSLHSDANEAEDFFKSVQSGAFSSVSTRDGHTQERVGSAGQSPRLDLGVIDQHMRGVLYDLHMGDAVNYVHRVLHGSRFKRAVEDTGHRELLHGMEDWLRDVATGEMPAHGYEIGIRFLRQNFTAAVLGFKATTALLQVTGAFTTSTVLGKKATLAGISRYKSGAIAMTKYVREQSAYMDQRVGTTVDAVRELSSARDGALKRAYDWEMRWAYVVIGFFQQIVDVQAWLGAESKGLEMFDGDIKKARAYADDIVSRSQGSQEWMDKNSLQRGTVGKKIKQSEVIRAFTTLGGYMIVKHNAIVEQVTKAKGDVTGINLKSVGVGLNLALNLCILMYADALVSGLIRGDLPDDDDDEFMKKWFEFFTGEGFASLFGAVPGIGALVSKSKGYDVESVTVNLWGDAVKAWDQAWQGEADMALARSLVTVAGDVTGIPASQINATLRAVEASDDGRDISPIDYLRGPPRH